MTASDARKLKHLESENTRFNKIVTEQMPAIERLTDIAGEKWYPR